MSNTIHLKIPNADDMDTRRKALRPIIIKELEKIGALPITGSILELGAGDGAFNRCIIPLKSVQFDNDPEELEKNPAPRENKVIGDALALRKHFKPESFDWVLGHAFFYFFSGDVLDKMLQDVSALLRPGGRLLALNDHAPPCKALISDVAESGGYLIPAFTKKPHRSADGTQKTLIHFEFCLLQDEDMEWILSSPPPFSPTLRRFIEVYDEERHTQDFAHFLRSLARRYDDDDSMDLIIRLTEDLSRYHASRGTGICFADLSAYFINAFNDAAGAARLRISGASFSEVEFEEDSCGNHSSSDIYIALAEKPT